LSIDNPRNQKKFADSLGQIDAESAKRFGKGIAQLTVDQRNELFAAVSASDDTKTAGDANHQSILASQRMDRRQLLFFGNRDARTRMDSGSRFCRVSGMFAYGREPLEVF